MSKLINSLMPILLAVAMVTGWIYVVKHENKKEKLQISIRGQSEFVSTSEAQEIIKDALHDCYELADGPSADEVYTGELTDTKMADGATIMSLCLGRACVQCHFPAPNTPTATVANIGPLAQVYMASQLSHEITYHGR